MKEVEKAEFLSRYLPAEFVEMCATWWGELGFELRLSRHRKSKTGDYRYDRLKDRHVITVNHTLDPWAFLITYTHEVAHCRAHLEYGPRIGHHGKEWKAVFRQYLLQLLGTGLVPDELARPLASYARNPRASTYTYPPLALALRKISGKVSTLLSDLEPGTSFQFEGREYTYLDKRRTRALCRQEMSGKKYLISLLVEVDS